MAALLFKTEAGMRVSRKKEEKDRDSSIILVAPVCPSDHFLGQLTLNSDIFLQVKMR